MQQDVPDDFFKSILTIRLMEMLHVIKDQQSKIGTAVYQVSNMLQQQPRHPALSRIRLQLPQRGARKITYGLFWRDGSMMMKP